MFASKRSTILFYAFILLFTLHITPASYINSNFLSQYIDTSYVSLVYGLASLGTIFSIIALRDRLKIFGNYKVFMASLVLEMIALLAIILTNTGYIALLSFIVIFIVQASLYVNLDVFLERYTNNNDTGKTRGIYLTLINIAFVIGPFLSSIFLTNGDFKQVYIFMLVLLFPILFFASEIFSKFEDTPYDKVRIFSAFRKVRKHPDIYATIMCNFILQFFYCWMVIYVPIYLYEYQHFSLSEIALIVSISLIPFVIIQGTAGKLADKYYGEKEMLTLGFIVITIFTGMISFITSSNISVWIAVLFMTRVGASMVEIMVDTHLFKRIDTTDLSIISLYRIMGPLAYIFGTVLGTLFLFILSFNMMFFVLAGIVLFGLRYSFAIVDTK